LGHPGSIATLHTEPETGTLAAHLTVDSVSEGADYPKGARIFPRVVLVAAFAIAIKEGMQQTAGGDFAVFWRAGGSFAGGHGLYGGLILIGERLLIFPPFAALLSQNCGNF